MGNMREVKADPPDTRKIKYQLKRADVDMLENVARQINAGKSGYAAGTLLGIRLTQKLLGLEKLAQGEDQEEITVTSYDLGMVNMAVLQVGDISAYSSVTKFGIWLALKILGKEDK